MKKIICVLLSLVMIAAALPAVANDFQTEPIKVTLNGEKIDFDVEPVVLNNRTLVPMRAIFEALGCAVSYQQYDGKQYVYAAKGEDSILLTIGENKMLAGEKEISLDAAPQIIDNRTLVPLRAVSESLECDVAWDNDTKTAAIYKKDGQYEIKSGNLDNTYELDDGTDLIYVSCSYPIIQSENELTKAFVESINLQYRTEAEQYMKDIIDEHGEDAKLMQESMGDKYVPMNFSLSYDVTINRKNWLSITTYDYENANGAHPSMTLSSKTFQMLMGQELSLAEVLGEEDTNKTVSDAFKAQLESEQIQLTDEINENIEKEAGNVNWYLTDNSLVMYFNQYQIGPYALGRVSVEILYSNEDGKVKVDLSEYEEDELSFELEGNPTTGYTWEVTKSDSDKIEVKSEYIADETEEDIVGRGGKYKFSVKGIASGNAELVCKYYRSFEGEEAALHELVYKLYISPDKKITVIDRIYQ